MKTLSRVFLTFASILALASISSSVSAQDVNRLRSETAINATWQWNNYPDTCRYAIGLAETDQSAALKQLLKGQAHNGKVQRLYRVASTNVNDFWLVVATASDAPANFEEARTNLNWQFENNVNSLSEARKEFRAGAQLRALAALLSGQRHNKEVMNLYRSCFRDDRNKLFDLVDKLLGS